MTGFMGKCLDWISPVRNVRLLQAASGLRNVCQGIALVDISLYLNGLGWSGGAIGGLFVVSALFRTVLTSLAAELNGLLGVRRYILLFELLAALAALAMTVSGSGWAICAAVIAAGFGRGHTGSGGPVAPIERAWLAAYAKKRPERLFGIHSGVGYAGLALGCLIAGLSDLRIGGSPHAVGYRPLFGLMALLALGSAFLVYRVTGGERKRRPGEAGRPAESASGERAGAGGRRHAGLINLVNGIAVTLAGTMTSYWLTARFGASAGEISVMMALSYAGAGAVSLLGVRTAGRHGSVRTAVVLQLGGVAVVAALPWVASFWPASLLSAASTALNLGSRGNRNAAMASGGKRHRRTAFTRIYSLILRMGTVLWPGAFGRMIERGHWVLPFYVAAAVQLAATLWYARTAQRAEAAQESEGREQAG